MFFNNVFQLFLLYRLKRQYQPVWADTGWYNLIFFLVYFGRVSVPV